MSSTASPFAVAAALALAVAPLSARPQGEPLSPYQVATTRSVATAEISPDGEHVAYVLSVPRTPGEGEDGRARSELHVLEWESGESRPYVTAESGVSVPELLRREAARLAARPTIEQWLSRTRRRPSQITSAEIVDALDEVRGPWPDADR